MEPDIPPEPPAPEPPAPEPPAPETVAPRASASQAGVANANSPSARGASPTPGYPQAFSLRVVKPDDPERAAKVKPWVERLAFVMDDLVPIPGTTRRVGIDGTIDMIPGVGSAIGLVPGLAVVVAGIAGGVRIPTIVRMVLNIGFDALGGAVPFAGVLFDFGFKANNRNLALIRSDLADPAATARSSWKVIVLTAVVVAVCILMVVAVAALGVWLFVRIVRRLW